jgi:serine/threonine protein kinase
VRSRPNPYYQLLSPDYYETFDSYTPVMAEFHSLVASKLPTDWTIHRHNIWFHCGSLHNVLPRQGWKIHVSAASADSLGTLDRVLTVLFRRQGTNFKFAIDQFVLSLLNSKNWSRGGAGKFITVYPKDAQSFLEIIEELHQATTGQQGPYILSDYRYKNQGVVFYRYGGMLSHQILTERGEMVPLLLGPDGDELPDRRLAFPMTPPWAESPIELPAAKESSAQAMLLGDGRYEITNVMAFSSAGGVYLAKDCRTGQKVVVKEARPHISPGKGCHDAIELLEKEHRLLTILSDTEVAPKPIDFFQEWEHWFLVEELIDGVTLASHSAEHNILLRTRPSADDFQNWSRTFSSLSCNLIKIVEMLHQHGIIFGDLSPNNLLVMSGSTELKIIDFEGAQQIGVDAPVGIYTPGFASRSRISSGAATFADDYYAVGAVLSSCLFPLNGLTQFRSDALKDVVLSIKKDLNLSEEVAGTILQMLTQDPSEPLVPSNAIKVLNATTATSGSPMTQQSLAYDEVITSIERHINQTATYSRSDRLFHADPNVFATNPLSLAHGAAGVAYALTRISDKFPGPAVEWILRHKITNDVYPPGLYIGSSGMAWSLLEIGLQQEAEKIFQVALTSPLRHKTADLFYGIAGWGMTALRFFMETQDQKYLDLAIEAGNEILEAASRNERGLYWMNDGEQRLGIAHGSSGIALFLLYLHMAIGESRFLAAGQQALDFDLSYGTTTKDNGLSWAHSAGVASPLYPYWRFGSAGVGSVVLRYYKLVGTQQYKSILEKIFIEMDRKYAVSPGRFMGLSGLGELSLDLYDCFGEKCYLEAAQKAASGIMLFRVDRDGTAFPGDQLLRLSCDYGTGSAGIALFLNRLLGRQRNDFMLDSLLDLRDTEIITCAANS